MMARTTSLQACWRYSGGDPATTAGSPRKRHVPDSIDQPSRHRVRRAGSRRPWRAALAIAAAAAVGAAAMAASPVAAARVVERTWDGSSGTEFTVRFVAYSDGTGLSTITLKGAGASRSWTPTFADGNCGTVRRTIARLRPLQTDATGAATRTNSWGTAATGRVWDSTRQYETVAVRLSSGAATRCLVLRFVRATRVQVSSLGIDLPVVRGGSEVWCNAAMYLTAAHQPPERGATFIYAHARTGMFLPLLTASRVGGGGSLIGKTVFVYTSDGKRYPYRITTVRRGLTSIQRALEVTSRQVWLQTSEGPSASSTKLVVVAFPAGAPTVVGQSVAVPVPHLVNCT
jgi:hypothetical protein